MVCGARRAHEVDLTRADRHHVSRVNHPDQPLSLNVIEQREVEDHVPVRARDRGVEVVTATIGTQPLHPGSKRVHQRSAIEQRDVITAREQPGRELDTQETISANHQHLHDVSLWVVVPRSREIG